MNITKGCDFESLINLNKVQNELLQTIIYRNFHIKLFFLLVAIILLKLVLQKFKSDQIKLKLMLCGIY